MKKTPGPRAPLRRRRPRRKMTARSYSWKCLENVFQSSEIPIVESDGDWNIKITAKNSSCCLALKYRPDLDNLDHEAEGEREGEDDQDDAENDQEVSADSLALLTGYNTMTMIDFNNYI